MVMPDLSGLQPEPVDRTGHLGKYYMSFKTLFAGPRVGDFHGRDNNFGSSGLSVGKNGVSIKR